MSRLKKSIILDGKSYRFKKDVVAEAKNILYPYHNDKTIPLKTPIKLPNDKQVWITDLFHRHPKCKEKLNDLPGEFLHMGIMRHYITSAGFILVDKDDNYVTWSYPTAVKGRSTDYLTKWLMALRFSIQDDINDYRIQHSVSSDLQVDHIIPFKEVVISWLNGVRETHGDSYVEGEDWYTEGNYGDDDWFKIKDKTLETDFKKAHHQIYVVGDLLAPIDQSSNASKGSKMPKNYISIIKKAERNMEIE